MVQGEPGARLDYGRLVSQIEGEIKAINPSEVYVCLPSFNQDHRVLYDATLTAFRPGAQIASLYGYEYPGNAWGPNQPEHGRRYLVVEQDEMVNQDRGAGRCTNRSSRAAKPGSAPTPP